MRRLFLTHSQVGLFRTVNIEKKKERRDKHRWVGFRISVERGGFLKNKHGTALISISCNEVYIQGYSG